MTTVRQLRAMETDMKDAAIDAALSLSPSAEVEAVLDLLADKRSLNDQEDRILTYALMAASTAALSDLSQRVEALEA